MPYLLIETKPGEPWPPRPVPPPAIPELWPPSSRMKELMAALGMEPAPRYIHLELTNPDLDVPQGYIVEVLGYRFCPSELVDHSKAVRVRLANGALAVRYDVDTMAIPGMAENWPWFLVFDTQAGPAGGWSFFILQAWLVRVRYLNLPAHVELLWHPERGERTSLHGLELLDRAEDAERILRGFGILFNAPRHAGGRPAFFHDADDFAAAVFQIIRNLQARRKPTTMAQVTDYLSQNHPNYSDLTINPRGGVCDERQLRSWCRQYFPGKTWPDLVKVALGC